jgi:hypothetical protein
MYQRRDAEDFRVMSQQRAFATATDHGTCVVSVIYSAHYPRVAARSCTSDGASTFVPSDPCRVMSVIKIAKTPLATASRLAACKAAARGVGLKGLRVIGSSGFSWE